MYTVKELVESIPGDWKHWYESPDDYLPLTDMPEVWQIKPGQLYTTMAQNIARYTANPYMAYNATRKLFAKSDDLDAGSDVDSYHYRLIVYTTMYYYAMLRDAGVEDFFAKPLLIQRVITPMAEEVNLDPTQWTA